MRDLLSPWGWRLPSWRPRARCRRWVSWDSASSFRCSRSSSGEKSYFGSFWGNHNELEEVLTLAGQGLIKAHVVPVKLDDVNENLEALGRGEIVGRAVIVFN